MKEVIIERDTIGKIVATRANTKLSDFSGCMYDVQLFYVILLVVLWPKAMANPLL